MNGESAVAVFRKTCSQRNWRIAIADQRAGQQPGFAEDLEPVADAQDQAAVVGELLDGLHHRAEPRDRAAAQIIAVAESAGHDDGVGVAERSFLVPDIAAPNGPSSRTAWTASWSQLEAGNWRTAKFIYNFVGSFQIER